MPNVLGYHSDQSEIFLKKLLTGFALLFILVAFFMDSPGEIFKGMETIILHSDKLITDYVQIAGFGATFFNAGLLMLICIFIIHISKAPFEGSAIAAVFLMGGFGMFGKNIWNVWSIILGVFLYSKFTKAKFSQYVFTAFFATTLSPIVTEIMIWQTDLTLNVLLAFLLGTLLGFLVPPIATLTLQVHQGYNLYNVGFAAGLLGTISVAVMRSFGYVPELSMFWYEHNEPVIVALMYTVFALFCVAAVVIDKDCIKQYKDLCKHSGRLVANFISMDGLPVVLLNMGLLGIVYTSYVLLVGGVLNGPTIGGVFTIVGFAGFGKHLKNTLPVVLGVALGAAVKIWDINAPSVLLGALFGTGLAPIAGHYGFFVGLSAGFIHLSVVLSIGSYHGGMNLYNNGFAAGLVALFLIPVAETLKDEIEQRRESKKVKKKEMK